MTRNTSADVSVDISTTNCDIAMIFTAIASCKSSLWPLSLCAFLDRYVTFPGLARIWTHKPFIGWYSIIRLYQTLCVTENAYYFSLSQTEYLTYGFNISHFKVACLKFHEYVFNIAYTGAAYPIACMVGQRLPPACTDNLVRNRSYILNSRAMQSGGPIQY